MKHKQTLLKKIIGGHIWLLTCALVYAAPEMKIARFTSPPKIDGILNDPCWQQAGKGEIQGTEKTEIMAGYDDQYLYIAFDCRHVNPNAIKGKICDRDGDIFTEDSVEVFLDPKLSRAEYYQFAVNCKGSKFDGVRRAEAMAFSSLWNDDWDAAAAIGTNGYAVEIGIPFRILRLGTNTTWAANFCRNTASNEEHKAWIQTPEFHRPEKFGLLQGINAPVYQTILVEKLICPEKLVIGKNELDVALRNYGTDPRKLQIKMAIPGEYDREFLTQKTDTDIGAVDFEIGAGECKTIKAPFVVKSKGKIKCRFLLYDGNVLINMEIFNREVETEFAFKLQNKLVYEKEMAVIRYESRLSPDLLDRVELKIVVSQNGKGIQEKKYGGRELQENAICLGDTAGLPAGSYDISAGLLSDGKPMVEWNDTFMIIRKY